MRRWLNRIGIGLWGIIGLAVLAALVAVLLFTQTSWGRRHVLALGLDQLAHRVHGYVHVRSIHGNLLTGMRLDDVVITDSLGRPFLRADTLALRYSLRSLLEKHLVFGRARLVNAVVVLDKPPHEQWNFARIFPTTPTQPNQAPGFGAWVRIENLTLRNGTMVVKDAWTPPDTLHGAALRQAIAEALSPADRRWLVPVPGGYQSISEFGSIDAFLPLLRLANPDSANRFIEIGSASMYAVPYRPPGLVVRNLHARIVITKDSLVFDSVRLKTPWTRSVGLGAYALNGSGARVQLAFTPLNLADARFLMPSLPAGGGRMDLAFTSHKGRTHVVASNMDLRAAGAYAVGRADFQLGRSFFRVGPSNVAFADVDTRLLARYLPAVPLKVNGTLAGGLRLQGVPASMQLAGWTDVRERGGPTSVILADGRIGSGAAGLRAHALRLRFQPLYLSLVRGYAPRVPYRGRVTGEATLTGSTAAGFALAADLVDQDPTAGRSRLLANGRIVPRNGLTARDLRLRFAPLQVALLKPMVPGLPYGGTVTGTTTLNGSTRTRLDVMADLVHESAATGRSHVVARGGVQLAGGLAARDLNLRFEPLQVALVKPFAPKLPYGGTLSGTTTLTGSPARGLDVVADVTHVDPRYGRSRFGADGRITFKAGLSADHLHLRFDPAQVALARPFVKKLPYGGTVTGTATVTGSTRSAIDVVADLVHVDPTIGRSHVTANGRVRLAGGLAARGLRLGFEPLQVAAIKPFVPTLPYAGVLTGTTTVTGSPRSGFELAADLTHVDPAIGRSHVTANGFVQVAGGFAARGLHLGFDPLQLAAVKPFYPTLPIEGTLSGHTDVTFSAPAKQLAAVLDLQHTGPTGYTHVIGHADARWAAPGFFDVNVRAPALSLSTVGALAPSTGLHGEAAGDVVARGNLANLTADVDLTLANGGGSTHTRGVFDLASAQKSYDFASSFRSFNAGAASTHAPQTSLTGTLRARGVGTNPPTATAYLAAKLVDSRAAGSPRIDTTVVEAHLASGLATFDRGHIRLGSAAADLAGSFGLVAGRSGTLHYFFQVDTLAQFASHVPFDTGTVRPRPLLQERRIAEARLDSLREARATEVQRLAVGYPPLPPLRPDTLPLRRDTLAGSLTSRGTLVGNIKQFSASGTAQAHSFSLGANYVGVGAATFSLTGYGTSNPLLHLNALADTVDVGGFAFDSARALVEYHGLSATGNGHADVALYQDATREYRVRSDFDLAANRKRLALQNVLLRFDTTRWTSTQPSTLSWAQGLTINNLELTSNHGGYLRANGTLPLGAPGDLRVDVEGVQLGDITSLLQDTASVTGQLGLHAHAQGTGRAPVLSGTATLAQATYGGKPFPDTRAAFNYAGARLTTQAQFLHGPTLLALAKATVPVNLALSGVTGPRLNRSSPFSLDLRADSLPLEALPSLTTAVSDVRGRVRGTVAVRGTLAHPNTTGNLLLDLGSLRVSSTGVLFTDITGALGLRGDSAYVDSLVAHSGGPVRVTGSLGLASLSRPSFNLLIAANDATLLDNQWGHFRADARVTARGPYTGLRVRGTANVLGGVLYAPEMQTQHATNLDDPLLAGALAQDTAGMGGRVLPPPNPLLENMDVNVAVQVQPDTWVRNSAANVEVYTSPDVGPVRVHMNRARQVLTATGTVSTDRGEYTYAGRVFRLSAGSATFMGGPTIDPLLQLSALYEVQRQGLESLAIQINVDGTLRKPRVRLASNAQPPLPQSDLLSFLAFGQPATSLLSLQASSLGGTGQGGLTGIPSLAEQQLASLAIGAMVDQTVADIEQQGTRAGLDVFRVHPGELPPEAAFQGYFHNFLSGTEIEAGKYVTPNVFVEARGRTSTLPGLAIEYRNPFGFTWRTTWEPTYLPVMPTFSTLTASQVRAFGTFLLWSRRF